MPSNAGSTIGSIAANPSGSGPASWATHRWHAEQVTPYPEDGALWGDIPQLIRDHFLPGHTPAAPLLTDKDVVVTLGSCFARELRYFLGRYGLASSTFWIPSGLNNTFAIADFVSWCVTGKETARGYRYDRNEDGSIAEWTPDTEQKVYQKYFTKAGALVFTLGLAEVWEDTETEQVFWRGVPDEIYDAKRHRFRLSTVDENVANIHEIIKLIRSVNAIAPIIFTLWPVPLKATFRPQSCVTADCVSKSTLRVALDQAFQTTPENVFYYPSFEIVKWLGCSVPFMSFGAEDGLSRHVSRFFVINILKEFVRAFFDAPAREKFLAGLKADGVPEDTSKPFVYQPGQKLK